MHCPDCGSKMVTRLRDESFQAHGFAVQAHAKSVPYTACDACGNEMSDALAARVREDAVREALILAGKPPLSL